MTSISGAPLQGSSVLASRLSILPGVAGALAAAVIPAGAVVAGLSHHSGAQTLIWFSTGVVAFAMVSGYVAGHYLGLLGLVLAALVAGEASLWSTGLVMITFVLSHEIGRFSLDARLPTRFGPGYLLGLGRRSFGLAGAAMAVVALAAAATRFDPSAAVIPVGIVLGSTPLFLRRSVLTLPARLRASLAFRAALGALVAGIAIGAALLGAEGRSTVTYDAPDPTVAETNIEEADAPTADAVPPTGEQAPASRRLITIGAALLAVLTIGLLFAALRRPEMAFELDELEHGVDSRTLSLSTPGDAELDDSTIVIDDRAYGRLLDDLLIDIAAEPDPARAIRFGYVTVESRLADSGIRRRESETEQELLRRALPSLPADQGSLRTLTALFERARFGIEPMTEDMRRRAVAAVTALKDATAAADETPTDPATEEGDA